MTPLDLHFCVQVHSHSLDEFLESDLATSHCLQCWVFCRRLFFEGVWKPWIRGSSRAPALMVWDCRLNARSLFSDLEFCSQAPALIFDSVSSHPDPEALNPNLQPRCFSLELGDRPDGRNEGFGEYSSGFQIQPLLQLPFPLTCFSYVTSGKKLDFSELQLPPVYVKRSVLEPSSSNTCLCREFLISDSLASIPGLPFPQPHLGIWLLTGLLSDSVHLTLVWRRA